MYCQHSGSYSQVVTLSSTAFPTSGGCFFWLKITFKLSGNFGTWKWLCTAGFGASLDFKMYTNINFLYALAQLPMLAFQSCHSHSTCASYFLFLYLLDSPLCFLLTFFSASLFYAILHDFFLTLRCNYAKCAFPFVIVCYIYLQLEGTGSVEGCA